MKKIGILGGAFNPPTIGHIKLAQFVLKNTDMEEVWLMPCNQHRFKSDYAPAEHRLEMCRIACQEETNIKVSDFEIRNGLSGSTYETYMSLKSFLVNMDTEFSFIIGMDNANTINTWKNAEYLKENVHFIVVSRQGIEPTEYQWYLNIRHTFLYAGEEVPETSSTESRALLKEYNQITSKDRLDVLLCKGVQDYAIKGGFYV